MPLFSACPSSVSGKNTGQFASPNYPNNYHSEEDCSWGVTVPDGFLVKVEFSHFNTERNYDNLQIYDGPSASNPLLVTLTGDLSTPRQVISTGSSLWFIFRTDSSLTRRGFEATFTAVDPSTVLGKSWKHGFHRDDPLAHGLLFQPDQTKTNQCSYYLRRNHNVFSRAVLMDRPIFSLLHLSSDYSTADLIREFCKH